MTDVAGRVSFDPDGILKVLLDAVTTVVPSRTGLDGDTLVADVAEDSLALLEGLVLVEDALGATVGDSMLQDLWLALSTTENATLKDVAVALCERLNAA